MNSEEALVNDYQSKDFIYFQQKRQEMLRYIPPQLHTILEVGCSGGRFGQLLKLWVTLLNALKALTCLKNISS